MKMDELDYMDEDAWLWMEWKKMKKTKWMMLDEMDDDNGKQLKKLE